MTTDDEPYSDAELEHLRTVLERDDRIFTRNVVRRLLAARDVHWQVAQDAVRDAFKSRDFHREMEQCAILRFREMYDAYHDAENALEGLHQQVDSLKASWSRHDDADTLLIAKLDAVGEDNVNLRTQLNETLDVKHILEENDKALRLYEACDAQLKRVADHIMLHVPGEPDGAYDEGAGDCAVRIMKTLTDKYEKLRRKFNDLHARVEYDNVLSSHRADGMISRQCKLCNKWTLLNTTSGRHYASCMLYRDDES